MKFKAAENTAEAALVGSRIILSIYMQSMKYTTKTICPFHFLLTIFDIGKSYFLNIVNIYIYSSNESCSCTCVQKRFQNRFFTTNICQVFSWFWWKNSQFCWYSFLPVDPKISRRWPALAAYESRDSRCTCWLPGERASHLKRRPTPDRIFETLGTYKMGPEPSYKWSYGAPIYS